jgi:mono/diheme cytochrome c family protein
MFTIQSILYALLILYAALAYSQEPFSTPPELGFHQFLKSPSPIQRGRDIWLKNTYGGEKFFAFLAAHPDPAKRINVGFENVITTPRNQRFQAWGTINDPDCKANSAGGPDRCADPNATGVIGIRKFSRPEGRTLYGVSCASCHVGFDPLHPPADVNEPAWENIHPTVGNQHLKSGKIIAANLPANDPRRFMFEAWPDGSVDTTALFTDNIMNPTWDLTSPQLAFIRTSASVLPNV